MVFNFSKNTKGILSIISSVIMNIICGSLYSWAGINGYFMSYLKYKGSPAIEIKDGYFFSPIITFTSMCFSPLMTLLDAKIGLKLISLMSTILVIITNLLLYYSTNIYYVYGCMVSLIYNSFADYIINPNYRKINPSTGFFDKEIAFNVKKYLLFFNIFNSIFAILSFLFNFEFKEDETSKEENTSEIKEVKDQDELSISLKEAFPRKEYNCINYG